MHKSAPPDDTLDPHVLSELRQLRAGGMPNLFQEFHAAFQTEAPMLLAAMRAALMQGQAEPLWKAAHRLKGGAANLGARRLAEACTELERQGRAGRLDEADGLLAELEAQIERVSAALQAEHQRVA